MLLDHIDVVPNRGFDITATELLSGAEFL